MIEILPFNASFVKIRCEDYGIEQELSEFFSFFALNYKHMPSYKSGMWDGKIRLFNIRSKTLPKGLIDVAVKFAKMNKYACSVHKDLDNNVSIEKEEVINYMNSLNLHGSNGPINVRDYQYDAVYRMLSTKRSISLAATSAGKSLMIYSKIRFHIARKEKVLLIVPTVNLVNQMFGDFKDYSTKNNWDVDKNVHTLYSGKERVFDSPVIISTWQSLAAMMKSDIKNFKTLTENIDVLIADEAHTFKADVVSKVIESFNKTEWRVGTSGTLDGTAVNELTLVGMFGPVHKVVTAKELMDAGQVTKALIKVLILKHPEEFCKALKGMDYKEEINQIVANDARNNFISNLAIACNGNTLILYNFVQRHGQVIHDIIKSKVGDRPVYFIHGKVDVEERDRIRKIVDTESNAIILATSSLFSTGTNIPSLENIIFAVAGKSNIKIRQSIGRGIRLKEGKTLAKIFDIADDYRYKSWTNTSYRHMESRLSIYVSEQFDYTIKEIPLKY